jgi:uncharacterized protein DUF6627
MKVARNILVVVLSTGLLLPVTARAQQTSLVDQATLDRAIDAHVQRSDADRRTLQRVLERQQVREIAGRVGIDIRQAEAAVATMDDSELRQLAEQARAIDESLAGGSNVTISTTTIIIALLVLILIIVAVN